MAIPIQAAAILAQESKRQPFSGKILQLGRQSMLFDRARFNAFRAHWGLKEGTSTGEGRPTDIDLFTALGFDKVCSCDVSNFEGAEYIFNLNEPVPQELNESFECIFDGGTVEHIFHAGVAMSSIARMLKVGGRAIHYVVSSNHIDHSFFMFSPTFFADFYKTNGFRVEKILLIENNICGSMEFVTTWKVYKYTQGMLKEYEFSGLGGNMWSMIIVATKVEAGGGAVVPTQDIYVRMAAEASKRGGNPPPPTPKRGALASVGNLFPGLRLMMTKMVRRWRRSRKMRVNGRINRAGHIDWQD